MHPLYNEFIDYLDQQNKEKCVEFAIFHLSRKSLDIVTFYNEILTPALYARFCRAEKQEICIWEEHVRTSIIRTVIENCYIFAAKERDEKYHSSFKGKVIVVCPTEELHELGARMVADFFTLCGYNVTFIGANTPQDDINEAIKYIQPKYVAISITNYYNLVAARQAVKRISDLKETQDFRLILGGQACQNNLAVCQQMNPDMVLNSFEDIKRLSEGQRNAAI
jgi:methanogenic corrinoid protein MtbC1